MFAFNASSYFDTIHTKLNNKNISCERHSFKRLSKIYFHIGKPVKALRMLLYANSFIRKMTDFIDDICYQYHWEKAMKEEDKKEYETSLSHYRKNLKILKKHPKAYGILGEMYLGMSLVYEKMEKNNLADRYESLEHDISYGYPHAYELERDSQWMDL